MSLAHSAGVPNGDARQQERPGTDGGLGWPGPSAPGEGGIGWPADLPPEGTVEGGDTAADRPAPRAARRARGRSREHPAA